MTLVDNKKNDGQQNIADGRKILTLIYGKRIADEIKRLTLVKKKKRYFFMLVNNKKSSIQKKSPVIQKVLLVKKTKLT